jgi:hypothetical protein
VPHVLQAHCQCISTVHDRRCMPWSDSGHPGLLACRSSAWHAPSHGHAPAHGHAAARDAAPHGHAPWRLPAWGEHSRLLVYLSGRMQTCHTSWTVLAARVVPPPIGACLQVFSLLLPVAPILGLSLRVLRQLASAECCAVCCGAAVQMPPRPGMPPPGMPPGMPPPFGPPPGMPRPPPQ